ncbi:MAG: hypothetical protein JWL61_4273 [Gemmatimonadetes bacterium]|nr:hypothetical protein [Gemmatimonadota bacterium]
MTYRALARAVAALHVAFVLFVVLGSLLVLRWPGLLWLHLLAVLWAAATLAFDLGCPLTPLEKSFWRQGGREPYPEGFLQHHVLRTLASPEHSRRNHVAIGVGVLVLNVVVYFILFSSRA